MDRGAWWAAVHGVTEGRTRLSDFPFTFHFHALEKVMATHSSVLVWRIPGTGEPGGLPSMGLHRVGRNWSDLAAAAAAFLKTVNITSYSKWKPKALIGAGCESQALLGVERHTERLLRSEQGVVEAPCPPHMVSADGEHWGMHHWMQIICSTTSILPHSHAPVAFITLCGVSWCCFCGEASHSPDPCCSLEYRKLTNNIFAFAEHTEERWVRHILWMDKQNHSIREGIIFFFF